MASLLNMSGGSLLGKGSLLPSGYVQLEYIESTGTQYIDTGVVPKTTLSVKIKYNILRLTWQHNIAIFGSVINPNGMFSGIVASVYYINNTDYSSPSIPCALNTVREEEYINDTMIRDGITYSVRPIVANNIPMALFGRNTGNAIERIGGLRIYYFTLYDNEVLICNFIPCKNPNNVVGMYDTVNGAFYSSPNGTAFIAGPEV